MPYTVNNQSYFFANARILSINKCVLDTPTNLYTQHYDNVKSASLQLILHISYTYKYSRYI